MIAQEIPPPRPVSRQDLNAKPEATPDLIDASVRARISDLFSPRPFIYWLDLTVCASLGWGCFYAWSLPATGTVADILLAAVAILALYRLACFTHELVHLRREAIPGLRMAWRVLCGVPLLIPHFLYRGVHIAHHAKRDYGTARDGEYFPFASRPVSAIIAHVAWNLVVPVVGVVRFTLLAWISVLSSKLRHTIRRNASSMTLRITFERELPIRKEDLTDWRTEESLCTLLATSVVVAALSGMIAATVLVHWYVLLASIATLNAIRAIGATHRYGARGSEMDFAGQVTDSVNVEGTSLPTLAMCPVGLRFHALHHLFPTLPYHNLGEAHRRLRAELPASSPYHRCSIPSLSSGLAGLWQVARDA